MLDLTLGFLPSALRTGGFLNGSVERSSVMLSVSKDSGVSGGGGGTLRSSSAKGTGVVVKKTLWPALFLFCPALPPEFCLPANKIFDLTLGGLLVVALTVVTSIGIAVVVFVGLGGPLRGGGATLTSSSSLIPDPWKPCVKKVDELKWFNYLVVAVVYLVAEKDLLLKGPLIGYPNCN